MVLCTAAFVCAQVIEYEVNGMKYQTLSRQGLTVIVTRMPNHVAGFGLVQVSISNGSDKYWTVDPEGYDGIGEETFGLLSNPCSINTGTSTMTLSVRGGETVYVSLRAQSSALVPKSFFMVSISQRVVPSEKTSDRPSSDSLFSCSGEA